MKRILILLAVFIAIIGVVFLKKEQQSEVSPLPEQTPGLPRLLDLGSKGCTSCTLLEPVLEELRNTYAGKLQVDFVDVWEHEEVATEYGVEFIPVQIFFDAAGREVYRHQGFIAMNEIVEKFNSLGINLHAE